MVRTICAILLAMCGLVHAAPVRVDTSTLTHYDLTDLYASYVAPGRLGTTTVVDFERNLNGMWDRKLSRSSVSGATMANGRVIAAKYSQARSQKSDLRAFIRSLDHVAVRTRASINWPALCGSDQINLGLGDCQLLQSVMKNIEGKDLLSYSLTELMPSPQGVMNLRVLDVILRNAGIQYFEYMPAIHDMYLSYGWYQFTSYALYDDGTERRGASEVCAHGSAPLPASVAKLSGDDHHRAAMCFAIYNVAALIRNLNVAHTKKFAKGYPKSLDDVVQYIAVAHTAPAHARACARVWVTSGMHRGGFVKAITPKCASVRSYERLRGYANKTQSNLSAVYGFEKTGRLQ